MRSSIKTSRVAWVSIILVLFLIPEYEATAPLFLQAITSALATIPFTGGPMTTGLVGAKLAIGAKLLYFLGFFGRRSIPKPVPSPPIVPKATPSAGFGGMQPVPLPYFLSGAGRFPQMGNNFGGMNAFGQGSPFGGMDPSQVFQALRAQGFDPNAAMEMINYGGFGNGGGFGIGGFGNGGGFENAAFGNVPSDFPESKPVDGIDQVQPDKQNPSGGGDDVEDFFTFLRGMDDNSCISRLVCDIGHNPSFLGDFSENIHNLVGSLDANPTSGAYEFIQIMQTGSKEGDCGGRFPACNDASYEIVKNVAPSVGLPNNANIGAEN